MCLFESVDRERFVRIGQFRRFAFYVVDVHVFSTEIPQEVQCRQKWIMALNRLSVFVFPLVFLDGLHLAVVTHQHELPILTYE